MTIPPAAPETGAPQPTPALSPWSVVSLALLVLTILAVATGVWVFSSPPTAPADAAVRTFLGLGSFAAGWCCALLGTLCGWAGVRNPTVRTRAGRLAVGLNTAVVVLGFCLASLLLRPGW
jgi:hypothetical protein